MNNKISVIIPTMKGREEMLARLISTIPAGCEIIVVDDEDLLLAAKRNKGAAQATGDFLVFIDDDNYLRDCNFDALLSYLDYYPHLVSMGVFGFIACYDDKKDIIADGGSKRNYLTGFTSGINTNANINSITEVYKVDEVANAFMIEAQLFRQIGGFDEENFPIDLDEADICKRIKDWGYSIVMVPQVVVYHKSQTYSHIPNFRRPMNAYFMGRNRQLYQRKHLNALSYWVYVVVFCPIFVCFYTVSLLYRKNPVMIPHFLKGVFDGLFGNRKNKFQK